MKIISGYVKSITNKVIEKKEKDNISGEYRTLLEIENSITLENNIKYITNKDISFEEGEYVGFTLLDDKCNKITFFINEETSVNIKENNKISKLTIIAISINIINLLISSINISNGTHIPMNIFAISLSFIGSFLFIIAGILRYKENKEINIFLQDLQQNFNKKVKIAENITL